jgi:hypothetical protein
MKISPPTVQGLIFGVYNACRMQVRYLPFFTFGSKYGVQKTNAEEAALVRR